MYLPAHFEEPRVEVLHRLIDAYPLGVLVTAGGSGLEANHLPFLIDPQPAPFGILRAHVARANPVWRELGDTIEPLVVFQGPSHYVTPSWYPTKAATGKVVPTYNYVVVHAYGRIRAIEDRAWLRELVTRLTRRHETGPNPWQVADAPADYLDTMLGAIVGLEIEVTRLLGKWKVSQNRAPADRAAVGERVADSEIGRWMPEL